MSDVGGASVRGWPLVNSHDALKITAILSLLILMRSLGSLRLIQIVIPIRQSATMFGTTNIRSK